MSSIKVKKYLKSLYNSICIDPQTFECTRSSMKFALCPPNVGNLPMVCLPYAQLGEIVILGEDLSF